MINLKESFIGKRNLELIERLRQEDSGQVVPYRIGNKLVLGLANLCSEYHQEHARE